MSEAAIYRLNNAIEENTIGAARPHVIVVARHFYLKLLKEIAPTLNQSVFVPDLPVEGCMAFGGIPVIVVETTGPDHEFKDFVVTKPHQRDLMAIQEIQNAR